MDKIDIWLSSNRDIGLLALRIFIGLRLIYGVADNVFSQEQMMEFAHFLEANNFPLPTLSAIVSVYVQLIGGLLILIGYQIRLAAAVLIVNFLVALGMVHINDTVEGMTPALAMLFGCITLLFTGAGKYSSKSTFTR
ncbi:DoxX family protein [Rhodocytophaga rosea]|uniref:DoxX family protein n=1 Tax=Rhodocytophaga rosea TaxID=2704465 RepID=A0A6C0GDT2_9BACT|nr:DoxX family protein [Rhodocytophaga rosea]QHT65922.1 DoxX family protein [Rhodocytophaga rosea]